MVALERGMIQQGAVMWGVMQYEPRSPFNHKGFLFQVTILNNIVSRGM